MVENASISFESSSLYVGDLHPNVTESDLFQKFMTAGNVVGVKICRDKITRQSLGYAYVNFSQPSEAERALDTLNFDLLLDKPMRIMWSQRDPALRRSGVGNVFIKNLDESIDNKQLFDTFSTFGDIISCKIMCDEKGKSKGYGFVHFERHDAAQESIKRVNEMLLNGKKVYVGYFMPKTIRMASNPAQLNPKFTNIYVKNFEDSFDEENLKSLFSKFGEITSVKIQRNAEGKSLGFGFVNFKQPEDAANALNEMNVDSNTSPDQNNNKRLYVARFLKKSDRTEYLKKKLEEKKLEKLQKYVGVNLYIKNLDDKIDDERLKKEFSAFGKITSAKVMTEGGRSKGFGFVCYEKPEEANKAVAEMNGRIVGTKPLYIALAQRKEDRRKILASQFRERIQNPQFVVTNPYSQASANSNMFYQYQNQTRFMPNASLASYNYPNASVRGPVPRWQLQRPNLYQQQQQQQQSAQMYAQSVGNVRNNFMSQAKTLNLAQQQQQQRLLQANLSKTKNSKNIIQIPGQEPLTTGMLAAAQPQEQKQMLGERLYPLIYTMHPDLAGKITGMLLEIDNAELLHMLDSDESLRSKVEEAVSVLQEYQGKQQQQVQAQHQ